MRCPACGTENTDKYCLYCGRLLKCQACGSFSEGNFCGNCGKPMTQEALSFKLKRSVKNMHSSNKIVYYYGATFVILVLAFIFYLTRPTVDNTASSPLVAPNTEASAPSKDVQINSQDDNDKKILSASDELVSQNKFEEAFEKLRSISANSSYYSDAQAKIDELLIPLAESRLKEAKKLFEEKDYQKAYATLQNAYGTANPAPKEILNLLPLYEKMATGQVTSDSNPLNITVTENTSEGNSPWTKSPDNTTSVDWSKMTQDQKLKVVQTVLIFWNNAGKKVLKDSTWFVESVDSFYKSGNEQYMLDKAMDIVAVGGMAIEN